MKAATVIIRQGMLGIKTLAYMSVQKSFLTMTSKQQALLCSNTVVEHSTFNPKIEGSNPAAGPRREKMS